jgi:hypothetical protein
MRHLHVCSLCFSRKSHPQGLLSAPQGCGKTTQRRLGGCHAETPDLPELTPQTTHSLTSLKAPLKRQLLRANLRLVVATLRYGCLLRSRSCRPTGCLRQATQPAPAGSCSYLLILKILQSCLEKESGLAPACCSASPREIWSCRLKLNS